MRLKKLLCTIMVALLMPWALLAQETTSDMQGRITDGTNGLAGATVIALHVPTGTRYSTTTRKDGRFNLSNMRIGGPYTITVTYTGYQEQKQENVTLVLGQTFFADYSMVQETKQLQELVVTATRQNKIFNTSHTGQQEIITRTQMEQLPTVTRSIQDFTRLEPTANGLSFAGTNPGMNNVTVDGADFNNSFGLSSTLGGQANAQPIALDAIDQIQVNISPYDVREGGFTGAGVNSVTRSGTNKFRATAYDYTKGPGNIGYHVDNIIIPRTPFNYNVLGASLGGPIVTNKLFFFVNAEEDLQSAPSTSYVASTNSNPPSQGSVSTANYDSLNAIVQYLKNNGKGFSYDPGAFEKYSFKTNSYKVNARVDWNVNAHNVLTLKYNYLKSYADQPVSNSRAVGGSGLVTTQTGADASFYSLPFEGSSYRINNDLNIFIVELNSRFGNSASNKFQVGYTRERDFRTSLSSSSTFPLVDILNNGQYYTTFGYEPFTYNNKLFMDSYQLTDIFSLYKGAHEITFGTQNSYKKYQNAFAPSWNGVYQFASLDAFLNGANAEYYAQDYSTLPGGAFPWAYAGATNLSLFAQDKWRVTNFFTLTYGIRADYTTYQNKFTDNPHFDALTFLNGAQYNVGSAPNGFLVVSPRVGFNWDVKHDRTLQIRGGAGVFEGAPPFVWIENQAANNGVQIGSFTESNVPFFPTAQQGLNYYLTSKGLSQTSTPTGYSVNVAAKDLKYPTKFRASLGIDKKLDNDWVLTGEFIYSKDIHGTYMYNANLNESHGFAITNGDVANGGDTRTRFLTTTAGSNKYYYQATSLSNPNLGSVIVLGNTSKGYSYSAVARIQKNFRNFNASLSYAYNNTMTAMENGSTALSLWAARPVSNTDPNKATLAHPSWYQPHRVIASANYKIPEGKFTSTTLGAVFEAAPAGATSYVYNGDLNGDGNSSNDLIYIPKYAKDIQLIDVGSISAANPNGVTIGTASDPRTSAQMWTQLNNFISQDHYMNSHRGQYAKANAVTLPYYKRLDLHIAQDIFFSTRKGGDKHQLTLSLDLVNAGNFLNRYWGLQKSASSTNFIKFEGMASDGKTPLFSFPYADAKNQVPLVNSFSYNTALTSTANGQTFYGSRWQMQFGFRYTFN
ncbi:TonB-dependent receptor [Dinghuibacter silviterrae]|uniref:Carboxypeptidase family protein n=1 Tax=Dinghuibacter silviterrae TaxID=1539049 RepID=A0A4R8DGM2_9BACT|nr:carboxypeptidase regulatory-like domain-containing protein [Dinghuibacter silviterrae]TDW96528.1 carboxypeptidase family protein [Dinghuibacter silviterrae]